ncbi:hypothetical protein PEC301899_40260 [Pectobacterium carotovorum subsp. carotovorum]|nr:hypothetical protein PEC301899_40260 [Pectobacterium carotovorum subsp. carotovorum]
MPGAARLNDIGSGHDCFPEIPITECSPDVIINGQPAARQDDTVLLQKRRSADTGKVTGDSEEEANCGWEDDPFQSKNPDRSGANKMSLNEAKKAFNFVLTFSILLL